MRWLLLAVAITAADCSNVDPAPLFIDVDYQVRCIDCEPRSPDDPKRRIMTLDGDNGYQLDCHASVVGTDRVLSFSAKYDDPEASAKNHSIEVLQVGYEEKDPGSKCEVRVRERSNRYIGKCTDGDPTPDTPCQVKLKVEDGIVKGSLFCIGIPNEAIESSVRYLVHSDDPDPMADDRVPATFEVQGCTGI